MYKRKMISDDVILETIILSELLSKSGEIYSPTCSDKPCRSTPVKDTFGSSGSTTFGGPFCLSRHGRIAFLGDMHY